MKALEWLAAHMNMATPEQRARVKKLEAETERNCKLFLAYLQPINTTQHLLIHRFPQLIVPLPQNYHGTGRV